MRTLKCDMSHKKKSTPIVSYCELPNDRVLSNSVTDAVPYGGRDIWMQQCPCIPLGIEQRKRNKHISRLTGAVHRVDQTEPISIW